MSKLFEQMESASIHAVANDTPSIAPEVSQMLEDLSIERANSMPKRLLEDCCQVNLSTLSPPVLLPDCVDEKNSPAAEAYRSLRTRLMRLRAARTMRSIVVTSCVQAEGKTLSALNLGLAFSEIDRLRIAVVDADVRTRGLSSLVGMTLGPGLTDALSGHCSFAAAVRKTNCGQLFLVAAGREVARPPDLFVGDKWIEFMEWSHETFDLVLIDSPPVIGLADCELIASKCDGLMMIVRSFKSRLDALEKVKEQLDLQKLIGVVMNGLMPESGTNYSYLYHRPPAKG